MRIREATPRDAEAVARLLGELGYPTAIDVVADRLAGLGHDDRLLVTDEGAGLVALHRIPRLAEGGSFARITALVVLAEHRRIGVGRALLAAAEETARDWGCDLIEVSSGRRPERTPAHELYRAGGFRDTAPHSIRYWKRLHDADR